MSDETQRPELTITEAAAACGVSRKTIRRRLDADKFPNAHRLDGPAGTETGPWVIPIEDLIAAGLQPGKPAPPDKPEPVSPEPMDASHASEADDELEKLREENNDLRRRAEVAEAELRRADQTIEAQAMALRMLEAGPPPGPAPATHTETATPTRPEDYHEHIEDLREVLDHDDAASATQTPSEADEPSPDPDTTDEPPDAERPRGRFRRWFFGE